MTDLDLRELLDAVEPRLRRRYLEVIDRLRRRNDFGTIQLALSQGRRIDALAGLDEAAEELSAEYRREFLYVADLVSKFLRLHATQGFAFDLTNWRTQRAMAEMERTLVALFRQNVLDAIRRGGDLASTLQQTTGLGTDQIDALARLRQLVNRPTPDGQRAISTSERDRLLRQRLDALRDSHATRMALWLGQSAVQVATEVALEQAVEFGSIDRNRIVQTWWTRADDRVRDTHDPMHGQERPLGRFFLSGGGVALRYPGDPAAPLKETRGCRCGRLVTVR